MISSSQPTGKGNQFDYLNLQNSKDIQKILLPNFHIRVILLSMQTIMNITVMDICKKIRIKRKNLIKDHGNKVLWMVMAPMNGQMDKNIQDISKKAIDMDKANIY